MRGFIPFASFVAVIVCCFIHSSPIPLLHNLFLGLLGFLFSIRSSLPVAAGADQ